LGFRKEFVEKEGFLEISGAQVLPRDVFKASGHLDNFNDPVVRCRKCQSVFRADQLVSEAASEVVASKKNVRLMECGFWPETTAKRYDFKRVNGGMLVQVNRCPVIESSPA